MGKSIKLKLITLELKLLLIVETDDGFLYRRRVSPQLLFF
jgi:hypothetical protein